MKETRINWNEVRKRMIDRDVASFTELSIATGINKNTLSQRKGAFLSTTVDRLANYLDCDPLDIIISVEVADPLVASTAPAASTPARQAQRSTLVPKDAPADPTLTTAEAER